jgi:BRCT domain type II-containing protein
MNQSESKDIQTISLLRVTGYGLLMLAFFDFSQILVPPRFTNPTWEFQMMGSLVERVSVPLIGLVLVFYGDLSYRRQLEMTIQNFFPGFL